MYSDGPQNNFWDIIAIYETHCTLLLKINLLIVIPTDFYGRKLHAECSFNTKKTN